MMSDPLVPNGLSEPQLAGIMSVLEAPWDVDRCDGCEGEIMLLVGRTDWDMTLVVSGEAGELCLQRLSDDHLEPLGRRFADLAALVEAIRSEAIRS